MSKSYKQKTEHFDKDDLEYEHQQYSNKKWRINQKRKMRRQHPRNRKDNE